MKTKEEILAIVKQYLKDREREYDRINEGDKIYLEENKKVIYPFSKYYEQKKNMYVVGYFTEAYQGENSYFVHVDADTGEVLYTLTKHGYAEDWEDNLIEE